ncbi:hypothetical protein SAE02_69240 [Skermanella aerolata]|uniref:DUF2946 domain-containing protein n=2 Tax=Skermanella aerolata TaxID=393310 RepID=A0A512E269_9PROT|nr:hypothetical protein N826_31955 [Skermanella aerolata KACC 11604]GEO42776.1 hypothetical protein SAE02_69240 [Skermanella aerolata]
MHYSVAFGQWPMDMELTAGMRLIRFLAAVLVGLLLGWGGLAMPNAAMAAMSHHEMSLGDDAATDCDEQPGHQGHGDHQHQGDHEDDSKLPHQGCCVMVCGGVSALESADLQVMPLAQNPTRVQLGTDDRLRDRSVSPLRRPPKAAA